MIVFNLIEEDDEKFRCDCIAYCNTRIHVGAYFSTHVLLYYCIA